MKFAIQIGEPLRADARAAGREKATADRNDAFDSVLAKVQGEITPSKPATSASSSTPSSEISTATDGAKSDPKAIDKAACAPTIDGRDSSCAVAHASFAESSSHHAVGTLLKRIKSNEDSVGADISAQSAQPTVDPAAVAVPLLSSLQAVARAPDRDQSPKPLEAEKAPLLKDAKLEDASAPPTANVILNISASTHVAPKSGAPGFAQSVGDEPPAAVTLGGPEDQETEAPQPERKVSLDTAASTQATNAGRPDTRGSVEHAEADRPGKSAQVTPTSVAADGAGASSRENASRDRSTDHVASKPVEDVSPSSSSVIAAQAPAKRIANAVVELARQASTVSGVLERTATTQVAPARTVTLQMSPAHLGTVEVRLHLTGQGLDLQLTISERETFGLVTREREALTNALQGQHYEIHSLVIQDNSSSTPSGGTHVAKHESSGDRPTGHHGREGPGGRTDDGRDGQDPDRQARSSRPRGQDRPHARVADGRSLFV